MTKNFSISN